MESKEFGLVAAQQLLQVENLHYGFWEEGVEPTFGGLLEAQERHTEFLFDHIKNALGDNKDKKILDSGCGIGVTTAKLLEQGYRVDGLVPSKWMAEHAREKTKDHKDENKGEIFECNLEDYPVDKLKEKYALVFFSESYQYVNIKDSFSVMNKILEDDGKVVIFDFFKRDNVEGKSPLRGGHPLKWIYMEAENYGYNVDVDVDVTKNLSQNLKLMSDILDQRVLPFAGTIDAYISTKFRRTWGLIKFIFRKKLEEMKFKYSQDRNDVNFEKYKTYRLIVLSRK